LLGFFSVHSGPVCEIFILIGTSKKRLAQDLMDGWPFMRSDSQNNLDEVDVLVICINIVVPKRSQKKILVFIYSKTYSGLSPLKGA
jgi:hypothetical protein